MFSIPKAVAVATLCTVSACGGNGGNSAAPRITATEAELNSSSVAGTSSPLLPGDPEPISPFENGGRFSMSWDVSANGIVDVEIAVREWPENRDPTNPLSSACLKSDEFEYFDEGCGEGYVCNYRDTLSCQLSTSNQVTCDAGKGVNLSGFLDAVPKDAAITIVVRYGTNNSNNTICDEHHVEFQ